MKYLFILLIGIIVGCSSKKKEVVNPLHNVSDVLYDSMHKSIFDSTEKKYKSDIDSTVYYFSKEMDCKLKSQEYTIKYYQTEKEKYRLLANKYIDSIHHYYHLLAALNKSAK